MRPAMPPILILVMGLVCFAMGGRLLVTHGDLSGLLPTLLGGVLAGIALGLMRSRGTR
jgi:hypothetical protein